MLSGAGISTNAGIPDFRGPNGIWTAEQEERKKTNTSKRRKRIEPADATDDVVTASRKRPKSCRSLGENYMTGGHNDVKSINGKDKRSNQLSFENASPTKTHKSITRLVEIGVIKFVITQNVDGLHRRSGLPRDKHAILHGCIFTEKCEKCHKEYFRDYDVGGISFQKTGRKCEVHTCNGHLRNTVLDWEDDLPDEDWELSQQHCHQSDLVIAIGTSLRIEPGEYFIAFCSKLYWKVVLQYSMSYLLMAPYNKPDLYPQMLKNL